MRAHEIVAAEAYQLGVLVSRDRAVAVRRRARASDRTQVFGSGSPGWIAVTQVTVAVVADATRLETRTTEPLVPGETTARGAPVSREADGFLGNCHEVVPATEAESRSTGSVASESGASNPVGGELRLIRLSLPPGGAVPF